MAQWQSASGGQVPDGAFKAGNDHNGPVYCARAEHEGDLIPGKVVPANNAAYVSWNGKEHVKDQYEVLIGDIQLYRWLGADSSDPVPSNRAISAGHTKDGETLYIGSVEINGVDVVGKIHPSHKKCYVPYGGEERAHDIFQILVLA